MKTFPTTRSCSPWFIVGAICVGLKLWLVAAQPVFAIGGASLDDRLFLELASHILKGEWLGPYNQYTLAKGPMYSLWIAATFLLGLPLPFTQHLLYLSGCLFVVAALRPRLRTPAAVFVVFLLLWWNPMSYEIPMLGRILRQNIYTPEALLVFAGLIALETRRPASVLHRLSWGALLGISGAALYLTREESVWVVPSAIVLVAAAAWNSWRSGQRFRLLFAQVGVAALCCAVIVGGVCALNLRYYGWFGTVEFRAPQFLSAYGALQRVIPSHEIPYVPVTREAREKIYAVSPAFAELRPFLEGDLGRFWAGASLALNGHPAADREMAGGWFLWALRDAVTAAGYNRSAADTLKFYARVGKEVNRACDAGQLTARPRRDTMMPPWHHGHPTRLVKNLPGYLGYFLFFHDFSAVSPRSVGDARLLELFRDLTRWHLAPSPEAPELDLPRQLRFDGWRISVLDGIGRAWCWFDSILSATALLGWGGLVFHCLRVRRCSYLFTLATATLTGCAAVVTINLLVHVMSFPNRSPAALAEAYPLLLLFGALVLIEMLSRLYARHGGARTGSPPQISPTAGQPSLRRPHGSP
jgi:hypothetical protein